VTRYSSTTPTARNPASSASDDPRWILVDVEFVRKLRRNITLTEIKAEKSLEDMILTRRGNRLSIMPIDKKHWNKILSLE
jgi:predicted RNA-binding protein with PUA-like domain